MAQVGRPRIPTVLKVLENKIKPEDVKYEPKPALVTPKPPKWLRDDKIAYQEWKRVVPALEKLGLITEVDGAALEMYCNAWSRWRKAEEQLKIEGMTFTSMKNNYQCASPWIGIAQKYAQICRSFMQEFGLSPSSRGRMQLPGNTKEDELDDLLD